MNSDGTVLIQWDEPDINSQALTHYEVEIQDSTGLATYPDLVNCQGDAVTRQCSIPVDVLTSAPYNLVFE